VFIHGVETQPEYNGRVAWVNIADWNAAVQAEAGPTVLSVELDNSTQRLSVRADRLCVVHPQLRPKPISEALVMIEVWMTPTRSLSSLGWWWTPPAPWSACSGRN
jgi:hypothetical protein